MSDKVLTSRVARETLGNCSARKLRSLVDRGLLTPRKLDGRTVYLESEVQALIASLVQGRAPFRGRKAQAASASRDERRR